MPRRPRVLFRSRFFLLLAAPALFAALYFSLRFTLADFYARQNTLPSLNAAIRMAPSNARYRLHRAEISDATTLADLDRAATLNPTDPAPWIALGLRAEAASDLAAAEQHLLEAARRDATYLPRWTLANFYFRRQQWDAFWRWAQAAADIYRGDATALYRLCLRAEPDPALTLRKVVPARAAARRQFVELLISEGRVEEAIPAAEALLSHRREADLPVLITVCERAASVRLWNGLAGAGLLPFEPLNPAQGQSLTNGDFRHSLSGHAFDWSVPAVDGVSVRRLSGLGGLVVEFSGRQPSPVTVLAQRIPVLPGGRYRLTCRYRGAADGATGCRWKVFAERSEPMSGAEPGELFVDFVAPPETNLATLELVDAREPGRTRSEGRVEIYRVELRLTGRTLAPPRAGLRGL